MTTASRLLGLLLALPACQSGGALAPEPLDAVSADSTFTASDGVRLRYVIDWPAGNGPFPAVVLVHGSGRVTRQDHAFLSAQFTARGWAVLRYDKRGVGESEGTYAGVGVRNSPDMIPQLAGDAAAGLALLTKSGRIDHSHLGYAGGSQAGWIIPVALRATPRGTFGVILSGPTVSVGLENYYSGLVENNSLPLEAGYAQLSAFTGAPGFDPLPYLREQQVPIFWAYGGVDRSIPTRTCIDIHNQLRPSLPIPFTVRLYPQLDHGLGSAVWPDVYAFLDGLVRR